MEYRIGAAKRLIGNLGPNLNEHSVQHVNKMLDIKEEFFWKARVSHGVKVRTGKHTARSDDKDYDMLFSHLTETRAHLHISGRTFGHFRFPENLLDDLRFNNAGFYRWLVSKNKEAKSMLHAKSRRNED